MRLAAGEPASVAESAPARTPAAKCGDEARRLWTGMISVAAAGLLVFAGVMGAPARVLPGLVPGVAGLLAIGVLALLPALARRLRGEGKRARALRTTGRIVTATRAELLRRPSLGLAGAIAYLWADIAMLWVPALIGTAAYLRLSRTLGEPIALAAPANVNGAG